MHVLVTRPEPDAAELKAALEVLGHEVSVEPLLAIQSLPIPATAFEDARGLIATSRNGLRALAARATLDAVILMSPRTAAIFAQLVGKAGLEEPARRLAYICLSANVAAALGDPAPARVNIAVRPNSSAILDAVGRVATHSSGV